VHAIHHARSAIAVYPWDPESVRKTAIPQMFLMYSQSGIVACTGSILAHYVFHDSVEVPERDLFDLVFAHSPVSEDLEQMRYLA
jgi:hypothetical protein